MLEIARQIDMPAEFVALRHEATHEELPSLQRLVDFTGRGLEWLWGVYWSRLDEGQVQVAEAVAMDVEKVKEESRRLLREFRSQRRQALKGRGKAGGDEVVQSAAGRLVELCRNQQSALDAVAGVLIEDKLLYPTEREYVSLDLLSRL